MKYFMGIDVGTSSTKVVLIGENGQVAFTTAPEHAFHTPKPGWAESDPAAWWEGTQVALREVCQRVSPDEISGIGLTGQMHGLVMLDEDHQVLRPCIMWNDQRTAVECRELTEAVGAQQVLAITGNPILPGFTAPKILWVQKHEPEVWSRCRKILLPKDYIRFLLSGVFATDVADASGMSLLDVGQRSWSEEMMSACRVSADMLAEVTESVEVSARVSAEVAASTGLPAGLPIVAGAGDQAAGAVGCGIVRTGIVSCTLGTSGVVFAHADEFRPDPEGRLHAFCAAVPGKWHLMGVQLSSAGSYQWFYDEFGGGATFDQLNEAAAGVPAGSEGLIFLPYLTGERTPYPDPDARGVFFGISLRHTKRHFSRAVMEGVAFGLRDGVEIMRELGIEPSAVVASGGGAKSPLWRQILADVFGTPIVTVNATEGAAYGAAILAAVGAGPYETVEAACDAMLARTGQQDPTERQAVYEDFYGRFTALYPALKTAFQDTARTVEKYL